MHFYRALVLLPFALTDALDLGSFTPETLKNASSLLAASVVSNYTSQDATFGVGLFGEDVYWWEAGATWGSLIDYWSYTGDDQYNNQVAQALENQSGPLHDYMPPNQTKTEGNDDQAIWGLAALTAAERKFPQPSGATTSWVDLAVAVFNSQVARWDDDTCHGGLRWQIFTFNKGFDVKNSESQSLFFLLAARLARYTGNQTYADWATKSYEWTKSVGLIGDEGQVYDATSVDSDCSQINKVRWSYTHAAYLYGCAVMANLPNANSSSTWVSRTETFTSSISVFFNNDILAEVACEPQHTCVRDQYLFKALTAQWLGETTQISLPNNGTNVTDTLSDYLVSSAKAAAQQCSGSEEKQTNLCGSSWTNSSFDGRTGLEQQVSALNVVVANLAKNSSAGGAPSNKTVTTSGAPSTTASATASPSQSKSSPATRVMKPVFTGKSVGCAWFVASVAMLSFFL